MAALLTSPLLLLVLLCGSGHLTKADENDGEVPSKEADKPISIIPAFKDPNVCCHLKELNKEEYEKCCSKKENTCDEVCPLEFPYGKGCLVNGHWYPAGATITANKNKCFYEKCCVGPDCPYPYVKNIDASRRCRCCEYNGFLYNIGQVIKSTDVSSPEITCVKCKKGKWETNPETEKACPAGTYEHNGHCLYLLDVWVQWKKASEICKCMGGWQVLEGDKDVATVVREKIPGCSSGFWIPGQKPGVCHRLCPGVAIGQSKPSSVSCSTRLRPLCLLDIVECKMTDCVIGDKKYENGQLIKKIDECMAIVCQGGYPTVIIDKTCCNVELANEIHLVSSGTVSRYGREKCMCKEGKVKCCLDCDELK